MKKLTIMQFDDLLASAFEGGSNYWYMIEDFAHPKDESNSIFYILRNPLVSNSKCLDKRTPKKEKRLNLQICEETLNKIRERYPKVWSNITTDSYDASDADIFLQMAVLDEVIYG